MLHANYGAGQQFLAAAQAGPGLDQEANHLLAFIFGPQASRAIRRTRRKWNCCPGASTCTHPLGPATRSRRDFLRVPTSVRLDARQFQPDVNQRRSVPVPGGTRPVRVLVQRVSQHSMRCCGWLAPMAMQVSRPSPRIGRYARTGGCTLVRDIRQPIRLRSSASALYTTPRKASQAPVRASRRSALGDQPGTTTCRRFTQTSGTLQPWCSN